MKLKKSLGQNFLKSKEIVSLMVKTGNIKKNETILEIGPGEGVMTEELLKISDKVIIIEKDHRLIPTLEEKFKKEIENEKLKIIEGDVLDFDIKNISKPYKIIANIPYYITGQILRKFLSTGEKPETMTLLVQKEVAERIVAKDKKESILSLAVKIFGKPKYIKTVSRSTFKPQPKVDSAIIHIENIGWENLGEINREFFFKVMRSGFAHKRKQLLSNLSLVFNKSLVENAFKNIGIDQKTRAEDVSLDKWIKLCNFLNNEK